MINRRVGITLQTNDDLIILHSSMVSVISTLMLDVSHAVEVLVFYVCWWCKMPQYIRLLYFLYGSCSCLCHIYSWFLPMLWVLGLSILLSICCVYMYVRLIMSSYLLFCIYFSMFGTWYTTCCPNEKKRWNLHKG